MTPHFQVLAGGSDISAKIADRLLRLEVVDNEGNNSDTVTIELDDRDAAVAIPPKKQVLSVSMGYRESGLVFMGLFEVADVKTKGYPRTLTIEGKSAQMGKKLKQTRNASYENKTTKQILDEMAGRHGMTAKVSPSLANFKWPYLAQTAESDIHLATQMARRHDALFKIANGMMLFAKRGEGTSVSGLPLLPIVIKGDLLPGGSDVISYDAGAPERPHHAKASSAHWDRDQAKEVRESENSDDGEAEQLLPYYEPSKDEAKAHAGSRAKGLARAGGSLNLEIVGRPRVRAEAPLVVIGVRPGSADGSWRIKTARHIMSSDSYVTSIDAEKPGAGKNTS